MNTWKKIALSSVSLIALASLAACGNSKDSGRTTSASSDAKDHKGAVTLWVDPANVASYKALIKNFNKEYPNIKVSKLNGNSQLCLSSQSSHPAQ